MRPGALAGLILSGTLFLAYAGEAADPHRAGQARLAELAAKLGADDRSGTLAVWRAALAVDPKLDAVDDLAAFQETGLRLGAALLDAGDASAASEVLAALWVRDRVAAVQPLRVAALRRAAKADPPLDAFAAACEADLAALPPNPGYDAAVRLRLATALLALGRADEADALAAKIEGDASVASARELLRAEAEGRKGDLPAALARLEKLGAGGGDRGAFLLGYDLALAGRNGEGAAELSAIPDASPYREPALFWTGVARLNEGKFPDAREAWTRQLAAFPQGADRADAALQLARLPLAEGDPQASAAALDAWLGENASAPPRLAATALAARAACARALGNEAAASSFLLRGAEAADDFAALPPALAVEFADALRQAGRSDAARKADEAALRPGDNPEAARARGGLALLALPGSPDKAAREGARADLEKALAAPGLPPAVAAETLVGLGDAYTALGQPGKAVACYQRVYVMYGAWPVPVAQAYWRSGQAFEKLGRNDEALATYRELAGRADLAAQPETALARKRLGEPGG